MNSVTTAIIPVAGLGTRVLPASKAIPKEMLPIVDKPAIQYVVEEAVAAGIKTIILVTRSGKEAIENHFDSMSATGRYFEDRRVLFQDKPRRGRMDLNHFSFDAFRPDQNISAFD